MSKVETHKCDCCGKHGDMGMSISCREHTGRGITVVHTHVVIKHNGRSVTSPKGGFSWCNKKCFDRFMSKRLGPE